MSQANVQIDKDLDALIEVLPPHIQDSLCQKNTLRDLLEVVLDLGRQPEARFPNSDVLLNSKDVTDEDIQHVVDRIGAFGGDNRAGIERTLHRISAMRNRSGKIVGLTLRVGRTVTGTIDSIVDHVFSEKSILLLGKPGVGKTTMLREVARVLADEARKRVVIVDTSNEIAGDGDIPHPAIGRARRMQVTTPLQQHAVMIEAVENHMPEVIIIDEMGTELEALAAHTIAERGVQLVATAHGNTLENLVMNPTLSDLIGGVQTVTLGDDEARRRGTQKSILERKAPPTFDVVVEIQDWGSLVVHPDVAHTVDDMLRKMSTGFDGRWTDRSGRFHAVRPQTLTNIDIPNAVTKEEANIASAQELVRIFPFGVNRGTLYQVVRDLSAPIEVVSELSDADLLLTTKNYYRRRPDTLKKAQAGGTPVYVLRRNTAVQVEHFLRDISKERVPEEISRKLTNSAILEAEDAAHRVLAGEGYVTLNPQAAYIRRLQHLVADRYNLISGSRGREPNRLVVIHAR